LQETSAAADGASSSKLNLNLRLGYRQRPSADVVQTTSRDILSIPERSKRASKAAGGISYGSAVQSGAARAEFIGIVMGADNLVKHGERNLVHHGERDLV
jgi:hypothetical protein